MKEQTFDQTGIDVQATPVEPVSSDEFDFEAYADYEASLLERCRRFWQAESGVLVNRRMRIAEVFSYGCKDMKASLEWQLGGLKKSMEYKADVPNFLTPWYGIGTVASAFGADYIWRVSDTAAVLSDMNYDMQSGVVQQYNIGYSRLVWPDLSCYFGSRYLRRVNVLNEKGSNALTFAATYVLDPRYTLVFSQQFDFDYGANIRSDVTVIRRYHRIYCGFTYSADASLDRQAVVFSIWPQGVPELALGERRYMKLGGSGGY